MLRGIIRGALREWLRNRFYRWSLKKANLSVFLSVSKLLRLSEELGHARQETTGCAAVEDTVIET